MTSQYHLTLNSEDAGDIALPSRSPVSSAEQFVCDAEGGEPGWWTTRMPNNDTTEILITTFDDAGTVLKAYRFTAR